MKTVHDVLRHRSRLKGSDHPGEVYSIAPVASVYDAIAQMSDRHVGALPVMIDDKPVRLSPRHRAAAVSLAHRHRNGRHVRAGCPSPHSPVRPSYPGGNVGGVQSVHFTPVLSFAAHVAQFVPLQ